MVSFILVASDKQKRREYIDAFAKQHTIDRFDITVIDNETDPKTQSVGLETIKIAQKKLFLTPVKSPQKIMVIDDAELLTTEAQNALLKMLEEPPKHAVIYLSSNSETLFLPTILSRCTLIKLEEELEILSDEDREKIEMTIKALPAMSVAEILKLAEQLGKDKEKANIWIQQVTLVAREFVVSDYTKTHPTTKPYFNLLRALQTLHATIKNTNVNPRFAIEHALLSIAINR